MRMRADGWRLAISLGRGRGLGCVQYVRAGACPGQRGGHVHALCGYELTVFTRSRGDLVGDHLALHCGDGPQDHGAGVQVCKQVPCASTRMYTATGQESGHASCSLASRRSHPYMDMCTMYLPYGACA